MQIIKGARGGITGHFGDSDVPGAHVKKHGGMDVGHGNQTADDLRVVAPAAGRVVAVGRDDTYGLRIIIEHNGTYSSLLAHLSAALVTVGQEVAQGEEIAVMGNTGGDWPVHLHQELRENGVQVDPEQFLASTAGDNVTAILETKPLPIGDSMPYILQVTDVTPNPIYSVGQEFIAHATTTAQAKTSAAVFSDQDEIHLLTTPQFVDVLRSLGIPQGEVKHLGSGLAEGHTWSRVKELATALSK